MRIIAGKYRGRRLKTTVGPGFRPAMGKVRESLFSMLESQGAIRPQVRALDLFAGGGSLGFEALSRGAAHVCFVESAPYAAKVIRANAAALGLDAASFDIRCEEVGRALAVAPEQPFSLVFIDPPYRAELLQRTLEALLRKPFTMPGALINAEFRAGSAFAPDKAHPSLEVAADRVYGQTRVILWKVRQPDACPEL
ncbi:MAG: 16S rRNA (guanine(966)-N(2))-methyltransferase RsmD [Desulfovibrio sp.]|jgi:16S rRNA (guanine966-N2)-methyltransferase|nr:16S rRNA (guanine(966)-N(2))-methyltransferase RsmD [Desulfovibrio sp.]